MLPAPNPKTEESGGGSAAAAEVGLEDCRWLLENLRAGAPLRIDCGGARDQEVKGVFWSRDRFAVSGDAVESSEKSIEIAGGDLGALYRTRRSFPPDASPPGYRIPLPKGSYDLTLHFIEHRFTEDGKRPFRILLEGKEVLSRYSPPVGRTDPQAFKGVPVLDGCLDITLDRIEENPCIVAIEIVRVE
jgi:hypothetical protein